MLPHHLGPAHDPARFALLRRLGRGGMGIVYEVLDEKTGARLALKALIPGELKFLPNLEREHRLVGLVRHPNVVATSELFQAAETWALTMELIEGASFLRWVRGEPVEHDGQRDGGENDGCSTAEENARMTTLSISNLLQMTAEVKGAPAMGITGPSLQRLFYALPQLGAALHAAHSAGLVHCDVKPSNVLVTPSGRLVLLDFGLACRAGDPRRDAPYAGTPAYMAPEQASDDPVPGAADCYAVGVMLYEALTGRRPFVGALHDLLHRKRTWSPVAPHLLSPGVPPELEALCLRLLDPDPDARPTAAELAAWPHRAAEQPALIAQAAQRRLRGR